MILNRIARIKYKALRLSTYITLFNTVVLITGFGWKWWYLGIVPLVILAYWFESKYGISGEVDVSWGNSSEWREFKKRFNELYDRVK